MFHLKCHTISHVNSQQAIGNLSLKLGGEWSELEIGNLISYEDDS